MFNSQQYMLVCLLLMNLGWRHTIPSCLW